MPKIQVHKQFLLTKQNGDTQMFKPGFHDVEKEVAENWFVKLHISEEAKSAAKDDEATVKAAGAAVAAETEAAANRAPAVAVGSAQTKG